MKFMKRKIAVVLLVLFACTGMVFAHKYTTSCSRCGTEMGTSTEYVNGCGTSCRVKKTKTSLCHSCYVNMCKEQKENPYCSPTEIK